MSYTWEDVADHRTENGVPVPLARAERETIAEQWNAAVAQKAARADAMRVEALREAALRAMALQALQAAADDPSAPQEVKDFFQLTRRST